MTAVTTTFDLSKYSPQELATLHAKMCRLRAVKAELSLFSFYRDYVWPAVEGQRQFVDNWHLHAIAEHLEAVTAGEISRLLVNVPFRTSKSTLVSVAWPAWVWLKAPAFQWLCGSYAEKLAVRDSLKMRRLLQSPRFSTDFPNKVEMTADQNQKTRFENTAGGYRIAFGMTGGIMGDGGDCVIIDDPHDRQGANSEAERTTALTTYDEAVVTRLNTPETDPIVIIMQRLHQNDLSGHVLKQKGWTHLMLPMRFEATRRCVTSIGFRDPRKKEGELLWPTRFPEHTVQDLEVSLGTYGTAGQLQQRPSPAGGGILQVGQIRLWPCDTPLPDVFFVLQSYDTAFTERTTNDPTACTVWGIGELPRSSKSSSVQHFAILLDGWTDHMEYPALRDKVIDDWGARYGGIKNDPLHPSRKADVVLVEEKGSGISLLQDLRRASVPVHGYNPGKADKVARAHMVAPFFDAGLVYVLESKRDPGKPITWARPLVTQCEEFPNGEHDDLVDTLTQALIYLRDAGMLELRVAPDEEPEDIDYEERRNVGCNPYSR